MIVFTFFRCWLKNHHLQQYYLIAMQRHLFTHFNDFIATKIIMRVFVIVARNTFMLMTNNSINKMKFSNIVKKIKNEFQMLLNIVFFATNNNSKFRFVTLIRSNEINDDHANMTKKIQKYMNNRKKLNIHIEIHYENSMKEFVLLYNCNILMNENKHKWIDEYFHLKYILWFNNFLIFCYRNSNDSN